MHAIEIDEVDVSIGCNEKVTGVEVSVSTADRGELVKELEDVAGNGFRNGGAGVDVIEEGWVVAIYRD